MYMTDKHDDIMCQTKSGNKIYWMLTTEQGAKNFELRYIEIPPGGKSSYGHHLHEHEVFVIQGRGKIKGQYPEKELVPGTAVFVPGDEEHQWINASETDPFGFMIISRFNFSNIVEISC